MSTFFANLTEREGRIYGAIALTPRSSTPSGSIQGSNLRIITAKADSAYALQEFANGWDGRSFHLEILAGATDKEADAYDVFLGRDGSQICCCRGFERCGHCKHCDACTVVCGNLEKWERELDEANYVADMEAMAL